MGKYPQILFGIALASALLLGQANALEIWGGSNSTVASSGATAEAGLMIGSTANELNYDLFAYSSVPAGSTGYAYSDWNIPLIQAATKSYSINGNSHDFTVLYRGHVQTGITKDSAPTMMAQGSDDASFAEAHVQAIAGVNPTNAKEVYGSGDIRSDLQLAGRSEGYAIASGLAGYSSAAKVTGTNNDFTKVEGAALGTTNLTGLGGIYNEDSGANWYSKVNGSAEIYSEATIYPTLVDTGGRSEVSVLGDISYHGVGSSPATNASDGSTSLLWSVVGSVNSMAWGNNSPVIKTEANANALTDITDTSLVGGVSTYKFGDYAQGSAGIFADANGNDNAAESLISTTAEVGRERTDYRNRTSAESYISGGTYRAVWRPTSGEEYSASGTIGNEYITGMASGAHLGTALPYKVGAKSELLQSAIGGNSLGINRTQANYESYTTGPEYTNNSLDDAGSYFGTSGYTTTSIVGVDSYSTTVASFYDINWINGNQDSSVRYDSSVTFEDSPIGSTVYDEWSLGGNSTDDSRYNDIGKVLYQTMGT